MPTIKDSAICVRHWDFSETSQTVGLFTREHGMIRGLAKGSKREKGDFSGGIDVLTRGEVVAILKPGRDLATLSKWSLEELYPALRTNLAANRAAIYMADLVHHLLTDADPHPELFDAFVAGLREVGGSDTNGDKFKRDQVDVDRTLLRFQWQVLHETGYQPELDRDAVTNQPLPETEAVVAFSSSAGGVVVDTGDRDRWRVRRDTIELLRAIQSDASGNDPSNVAAGYPPATVDRANRLLAAHFRELLGGEPASMRWAFPKLRAREDMS